MNQEKPQIGICSNPKHPEYNGLSCLCANCEPEDEICISLLNGGGCAVCNGPVLKCEGFSQPKEKKHD